MTPPPNAPLPPGLADRIHAYFASFLSPAAADEAMADLAADLRGSEPPAGEVLRRAHDTLAARVDVPLAVELPVLLEDLGVPVDLAAHVVGAPVETVERLATEHDLDRRAAALWTAPPPPTPDPAGDAAPLPTVDPAHDDASPDAATADAAGPAAVTAGAVDAEPGGRGRAVRRAVLVVVVLVAVAAAALLVLGRSPGNEACEPRAEQPVCVVEARLTHVIDASGNPGAPRSSFTLGEPVRLWFRYETLDPTRGYTVDYVWFHGDRVLYATDFALPPVGRVNLTLAQAVVRGPGEYRVEVRLGDDVLVDRPFRITR